MNVHVGIDPTTYESKPKKNEAGTVRKRAADNWCECDMERLAGLAATGHAILPGHLVNGCKAENWTEMQLLVLDFDDGISFIEISDRCKTYELSISFAYHTFSSSAECEKFRVVFSLYTPTKDAYAAKILMLMLHKIFPECDKCCTDLCRCFYGGKGLLYLDKDACIALVQLCDAFQTVMNRGDNYQRNIKNFCLKNSIFMMKGCPVMGAEAYKSIFGNFDEIMESTIIHIITDSTNTSFFIAEAKPGSLNDTTLHQGNTCPERMRKFPLRSNRRCQLLNDFCEGGNVDHGAMFALLNNLMHVNGGEKYFFEILSRQGDADKFDKWKKSVKYMRNYHSMRCSECFCPYYGHCEDNGTIIDTLADDRMIKIEPESYYPMEDARKNLRRNLEEAILSNRKGIHLIKAQTALGKTHTYINLIAEHPEKKFLVALPTNLLKEEVYKKIRIILGEKEVAVTLSVDDRASLVQYDIKDEIHRNHERGQHHATRLIVKKYLKKVKKETPEAKAMIEELEKLMSGLDAIKDHRVIITTHAFMLQLPLEFLSKYIVIVDEDILLLQLFKCIKSVPESILESLAVQNINEYSALAKEILNAEHGVYQIIHSNPYANEPTEEQLNHIEGAWNGNIPDLKYAESFVKLENEEEGERIVYYYCPPKLQSLKYIVLSATLNDKLYKIYFKKQGIRVYDNYPEMKAEYRGRLLQWTYYSLGRQDLSKRLETFDYAKEVADDEKLCFITFVNFPGKSLLKNVNFSKLHFGNAIGVNSLSGKNIGVVGTYFQQEQAYKLVGCYLGADVNTPTDKMPHRRRVDYKNKNFVITTYKNDLLREIQLYSIESEMEQCIGRARLLSKDCTVYLFSCFPCEQAILNTGNYLKKENK
ncbi:MAG: hypothetical protein LIP10_12340 [Clostridiales bacterium]|nr:hypothetical protein [Clostridiales bacterium]